MAVSRRRGIGWGTAVEGRGAGAISCNMDGSKGGRLYMGQRWIRCLSTSRKLD